MWLGEISIERATLKPVVTIYMFWLQNANSADIADMLEEKKKVG